MSRFGWIGRLVLRESLLALPREAEPTGSGWGGERVTSDVNKDGGGLSCMGRGGASVKRDVSYVLPVI